MPGRGPAPKDRETRRRRNADPVPTTKLPTDGDELHGPDLPEGVEWPHPTVKWWDTWRRSPQGAALTETDWDFLADTALLHARFWEGDASVAGELRLRVAKFGATIEDRQRLRMQIGEPAKTDDGPKGSKASGQNRYAHLRVAK